MIYLQTLFSFTQKTELTEIHTIVYAISLITTIAPKTHFYTDLFN